MSRLAALGVLLLALGCSTPSSWPRSRAADLLDAVPVSVAAGWGVGISGQATPLLAAGLSATPVVSNRAGFDDRVIWGTWEEYQAGFPWTWDVRWRTDVVEPPADEPFWSDSLRLSYRWQRMADAPGGEGYDIERMWEPNTVWYRRHPPVIRESFGALGVPMRRGWILFQDERRATHDTEPLDRLGSPERGALWTMRSERLPAQRAWDLFELDAFAGIFGLRVGFRPVEAVDFLLGIVFLDPMQDDLPEASSGSPPDSEVVPSA